MDRRVKERLLGASILAVLIVLIVPELLSGPAPPAPPVHRPPASTPQPVRNITVDLATNKAAAAEPAADAAASTAVSPETVSAAAASAAVANAEPSAPVLPAPPAPWQPASPPPQPKAQPQAPPPRAAPSARLETAAPVPISASKMSKPATGVGTWAVQLGSFANRANADKLMRKLKAQGFPGYVVSGGAGRSLRYRVRVGPMADRGAAAQAIARLKSLGHAASFVHPAT